MNIVDPRKLDCLREVIDSEISERSIQATTGRTVFMEKLAKDLGYDIEIFKVDDWYVATAQSHADIREIRLYEAYHDWERACEVDINSRFELCAAAASAEEVAIALLLQMLDDTADVYHSKVEFARHYPGDLGDFPLRLAWCVEWYLRADVWYQDVTQIVDATDRDAVVMVGLQSR